VYGRDRLQPGESVEASRSAAAGWQMVVDVPAQRVVKTGGRLIKHARYCWRLREQGHLACWFFGEMLRQAPEGTPALPVPAG